MEIDGRYINQIEIVTNIFTINKGKIMVLLFKKTEEPFKGYWMLPNNLLMTTETIEECACDTIFEWAGLKDIFLEQCNIFSQINRLPNNRILANSLIALVDYQSVQFKMEERSFFEFAWFDINSIPKMVYDHREITMDAAEYIKRKILNSNILRKFYPADFTLPELQNVYEQSLGKKLDRRNFRKKILNLDFIESTGYKMNGGNGRPALLYKFKEEEKEIQLF